LPQHAAISLIAELQPHAVFICFIMFSGEKHGAAPLDQDSAPGSSRCCRFPISLSDISNASLSKRRRRLSLPCRRETHGPVQKTKAADSARQPSEAGDGEDNTHKAASQPIQHE